MASRPVLFGLVCLLVFQQQQPQLLTVDGAPVQVNAENVEETLAGRKATFMMFYGSQCEDCEDMTPEWNRLADEWEGHEFGQIAQADCESKAAEAICDYFQIQEIPTLVVGGSMEWDFYQGSHDYESLSAFAQKSISKPICSARVPENCNTAELQVLQSLDSKSTEELVEMYEQAQAKMQESHEQFQEQEALILEQQHILMQEFNAILAEAAGEYDFKILMQMMEQRVKAAAAAAATEAAPERAGSSSSSWGVKK